MKEIIKTTHLEYNKSHFFIDLIKHESGKNYIEISQVIQNDLTKQSIKLNSDSLSDILKALMDYQPSIGITDNPITKEDSKKIITHYLKGVSLRALSKMYAFPLEKVESIIETNGLALTHQDLSKKNRK